MFGAELLLLAMQPANSAQPLLDVAIEACDQWVHNEQYRTGGAQDFVERSGLGSKGLFVVEDEAALDRQRRFFQVGTQSHLRIEATIGLPECRFLGFGDREFWAALRDAIETEDYLARWSEIGSFKAHRMFADVCYQSSHEPHTNLHIRYGYFVRADNDVDFVGNVTPVTDTEPCPYTLNS